MAAIIGGRDLGQLEGSLAALDVEMTDELREQVSPFRPPGSGYRPHRDLEAELDLSAGLSPSDPAERRPTTPGAVIFGPGDVCFEKREDQKIVEPTDAVVQSLRDACAAPTCGTGAASTQ